MMGSRSRPNTQRINSMVPTRQYVGPMK
jgi:hypothetical protein